MECEEQWFRKGKVHFDISSLEHKRDLNSELSMPQVHIESHDR